MAEPIKECNERKGCIKGLFGKETAHNFVDIYDEEDISIPKEVISMASTCLSAEGSKIILESGTIGKCTWVKTYCSKCGLVIERE